MVSQVTSLSTSEIVYPDSDGQPISDRTKQFRWIVVVQQNLEWLFADHPQVLIAGDLLWYPVQGNPKVRQAPDVMVVFGRPKGERGSYQQWNEGDIVPQVVFEILSPGNTLTEMNKKQVFYDRYGVEEYYLYDPERNDLSGWLRSQERLDVIDPIANWVSPRLGIRFDLSGEELALIRPDGERFATYVEIQRQLAQLQARVLETESLLEQERLRAERLAQRLREAGIDPDAIET
ncbi:MAG: Uma2 family endonuclease [Desertifilum sp. SIO1I2]|nr:Uma2 family endonuclease [Desertifilum sp. SIO1I2]